MTKAYSRRNVMCTKIFTCRTACRADRRSNMSRKIDIGQQNTRKSCFSNKIVGYVFKKMYGKLRIILCLILLENYMKMFEEAVKHLFTRLRGKMFKIRALFSAVESIYEFVRTQFLIFAYASFSETHLRIS